MALASQSLLLLRFLRGGLMRVLLVVPLAGFPMRRGVRARVARLNRDALVSARGPRCGRSGWILPRQGERTRQQNHPSGDCDCLQHVCLRLPCRAGGMPSGTPIS